MSDKVQIRFKENGPILLKGEVKITNADGVVVKTESAAAFCRCGHSANKPYCDGSHVAANFVAPEGIGTASSQS